MWNRLSGGSLGSHNDEERSKARYELRIAELVNHHIFERIMHRQTFVFRYAFLSIKSQTRLLVGICCPMTLIVQLN